MLDFPLRLLGFFFIAASFACVFLLLLLSFLFVFALFLLVFLCFLLFLCSRFLFGLRLFLLVFLRFLLPFGGFFLFQLRLFPLALLRFASILSVLFGRCGSFAFGLLLGLFPFDLRSRPFGFMPPFGGEARADLVAAQVLARVPNFDQERAAFRHRADQFPMQFFSLRLCLPVFVG